MQPPASPLPEGPGRQSPGPAQGRSPRRGCRMLYFLPIIVLIMLPKPPVHFYVLPGSLLSSRRASGRVALTMVSVHKHINHNNEDYFKVIWRGLEFPPRSVVPMSEQQTLGYEALKRTPGM